MARTRQTPPASEIIDGESAPHGTEWRMPVAPGNVAPPDEEDDEEDPLQSLLATMQGSSVDRARVKLYRKTPTNAQGEWCSDYSVQAFMEGGPAMVRAEWGPGNYIVMVYGPHPNSGKVARLAYQQLDIAIPRTPAAAAALPAPAQPSVSPELLAMMKSISDGQAAIAAALAQRPDPTAEMQRTFSLMAQMREAMGLNVAPPVAPVVNPSSMLTELVQAMKTLKEVSNEFGDRTPDPDSPTALMGSIVDVVKTVASNPGALAAMTGAQPTAPTPVQPLALPASLANASQPAQAEHAPEDGETVEQMMLKGFVQKLVTMAKQGEDPKKGGEFIADAIPDEFIGYLKLPNWFDIVSKFAPELAPHRAWVEAAKVHAEALLSQDTSD